LVCFYHIAPGRLVQPFAGKNLPGPPPSAPFRAGRQAGGELDTLWQGVEFLGPRLDNPPGIGYKNTCKNHKGDRAARQRRRPDRPVLCLHTEGDGTAPGPGAPDRPGPNQARAAQESV